MRTRKNAVRYNTFAMRTRTTRCNVRYNEVAGVAEREGERERKREKERGREDREGVKVPLLYIQTPDQPPHGGR